MLIELKSGETYNGHLVACDTWMNLHLREVILTSREGELRAQQSLPRCTAAGQSARAAACRRPAPISCRAAPPPELPRMRATDTPGTRARSRAFLSLSLSPSPAPAPVHPRDPRQATSSGASPRPTCAAT